jgi:hypothetical protein
MTTERVIAVSFSICIGLWVVIVAIGLAVNDVLQ